jgi:hypothetical protein
VVCVQAEGNARIVTDIAEAEVVLELYVEKYSKGEDFVTLLKAGKNHHQLYCFTPQKVMLFDERTGQGVPYGQIELTD